MDPQINFNDQDFQLVQGTLKVMLDLLDSHTMRLRELTDRISAIEQIIKER